MPLSMRTGGVCTASRIEAWLACDSPRLLVSGPAAKKYLVSLGQAREFIQRVGISSSNHTGHSGFDYVTVGAQRCAIQSINAINPAEQADLTEARSVESAPDSGS